MKRNIAHIGLLAAVLAVSVDGERADAALRPEPQAGALAAIAASLQAAQRDGMSLSEAVESVRRRGNVERVISAETRVRNGREVHYIRVMTKDGKVQTVQVPGRRRS